MKNTGSVLSVIGGIIVLVAAVASIISNEFNEIWKHEFSAEPGFIYIAAILAILVTILAFLSFTSKPRLLGMIIMAASFAGIIVGSTLTDIAMLFSVCGGIILFSLPAEKKVKPAKPSPQQPNKDIQEPPK
ncbi:MAG: hypothetical protein ACP5F3_02040 [Candidatus Syntrophosphaera sp.]